MSGKSTHLHPAAMRHISREAVDATESGPPRMAAVRRTTPAPQLPAPTSRHRAKPDVTQSGPTRAAGSHKKA